MIILCGASLSAKAEEVRWTEKGSFKGDLRLREEWIDQEGKNERTRTRLRARLSATAQVNDTVQVKLRLASGSDDPVSSNQTLDDGFSSKDIQLDRAYVIWSPDKVEGIDLLGGKMLVLFLKVKGLLWDGDLNPEGVAAQYTSEGDVATFYFNGAVLVPEERSSESETYLYGVQAAVEAGPVIGGAGFFYYDNMRGFPTFFDPTDGFGNDVVDMVDPLTMEVTQTLYAEDFSELELFAKAKLDLGIPVMVYGDYVNNTEATTEDSGFMFGITFGKSKDPGTFQMDYNYPDLEANVVVGIFTDSDSGGGGTDVEGYRLQAKHQLAKSLQLSATIFVNEIDNGSKDYNRGQLDLIAKF